MQDLEFEWDEEKYSANVFKHNVNFEEAAEVFFDRFYLLGDASVDDEQRVYLVGFSYSTKMLFVVSVERGVRMRILSARPATSQERNDYDEQF